MMVISSLFTLLCIAVVHCQTFSTIMYGSQYLTNSYFLSSNAHTVFTLTYVSNNQYTIWYDGYFLSTDQGGTIWDNANAPTYAPHLFNLNPVAGDTTGTQFSLYSQYMGSKYSGVGYLCADASEVHYCSSPSNWTILVPPPPPFTPAPTPSPKGTGLTGSYYNGQNFNSYVGSRVDSTVDFNYGSGGPTGIPGFTAVDNFSVKWLGYVLPVYSGQYTFYCKSDDGCKVYVDSELIIYNWYVEAVTMVSGTITLQAGTMYSIEVDYFEDGGLAEVHLGWACTSQPLYQVVPQSQLFPESAVTPLPSSAFLQSKLNGLYIALTSNLDLIANAASTSSAQFFQFTATTGGENIQAQNGEYVCADNGGGSSLIANRASASIWENFTVSQPQPGYFAFTAVNGLFVAVQSGSNLLQATSSIITDATLFSTSGAAAFNGYFVDPTITSKIVLYSVGARAYLYVNSGNYMVATSGFASGAAAWNVAAISGGYSLQFSATLQYASADAMGTMPVIVNRDSPGSWETFNFVPQPSGTYAILAEDNNRLIALQSNGQFLATVANSGTIPASALFYVVAPIS